MLAGERYDPADPEVVEARMLARERYHAFNHSHPRDVELRRTLIAEIFGRHGEGVTIEPPFRCDDGTHIFLGNHVYFNMDCVILDVCSVQIGDHVFIAPGVHIYTATHPLEAAIDFSFAGPFRKRRWAQSPFSERANPAGTGSLRSLDR
ncbi:maltose acetyltransferase domain-containing protein [Allorhodopirellula solitaria]|uniref:Maltose O-acetyltransferase n=1 Tax=Allorhodopirellula solitaria TaxID=2527987 RepID=A0A5C5WQD0_9BACT|nr:maltose acetyltransferase domain-containing protein [Allorhodopirellula solitaria]TWT52359.1 Maltose O-acetyltransferase [Allorhodopirellula solitaria]